MSAGAGASMEVDIQSVAAGGDGVGRADGLVIFVPRTAPGDRVRVQMQSSKRFARGKLESVLRSSPQRVTPPCAHYRVDECGGCQLQHLSYDAQIGVKSAIVRDAIERIGKRRVELPEVRPSGRQWRYRAKLTLAIDRTPRGWVMGLHPYDDPVAVFQLADCPITDEGVVATWREVMSAAHHLPTAPRLRGSVRLAGADGGSGCVVVIEGGTLWKSSGALLDAVPSASAVWWKPEGGSRRLVAQRAAAPAGASFMQVNADVAAELRTHVLECAARHAPAVAVDAYAGVGDTAVPLAEAGARVTAIELDRDAARQCAARLPAGSRALEGRVEDLLGRVLPADVILVNPPRTGLQERVPKLLERHAPSARAILYVSCNPATLARDVARLPSYDIASLVSFDMFPQTAHVETVCELVPRARRST